MITKVSSSAWFEASKNICMPQIQLFCPPEVSLQLIVDFDIISRRTLLNLK